jgi:hypothetical protein
MNNHRHAIDNNNILGKNHLASTQKRKGYRREPKIEFRRCFKKYVTKIYVYSIHFHGVLLDLTHAFLFIDACLNTNMLS